MPITWEDSIFDISSFSKHAQDIPADEDIRCPVCMDEQMESRVTVYWISHVEDGRVLHAACDRGHEFEEVVTDAD